MTNYNYTPDETVMEDYNHSLNEIKKALDILLPDGAVGELRILNTKKGTISGYFNNKELAAQAAAKLSGKVDGVYISLNPVIPDLLARSTNRLKPYSKTTTSDAEILRRNLFLIDLDAKRPKGIQSTAEQHDAAIEKAHIVKDFLTQKGWSKPFLADSGNGAHLLYRIDLPNDDNSRNLLQNCLKAIDMLFSDDIIDVDLSVYNAARIVKLYGTKVCKGDNTPERPHRLSRLLEVPNSTEIVSVEKLEELASIVPKPEKESWAYNGTFDFNLEEWINKQKLPVKQKKTWNQGTLFILEQCPWNPEHDNGSAFVTQFPNGAISAGCHHNSCQGKGWHDLRDLYEPGWRETRTQNAYTYYTQNDPEPWDSPIPFADYELPTFPGEIFPNWLASYVNAEAETTQTPTDLTGMLALSICATSVGRKVEINVREGWTEPINIFTVVALPPASRKSAVFADIAYPIVEYEKELSREIAPKIEEAKTRQKITEQTLQTTQNSAVKTEGEEKEQLIQKAVELSQELSEIQIPVTPRLVADDCSPEKLANLLQEQGGRLLFCHRKETSSI